MRARECWSRCGPSAYTFLSRCHLLGCAGTRAWRRAAFPTVTENASHLRCHPARQPFAAKKRPLRCGSKVLEKHVAYQNGSITSFNNGKRGLGCKGVILRVREEKTSETEGKRENEDMKSWWQKLLKENGTQDVYFFIFFKSIFLPQRVGLRELGTNLRLIYLVWWSRKGYHSPSMHFD